MGLIPVNLRTPQLAAGEADHGDALEFTPVTLTIPCLRSRESWRIDFPAAIVSTSVIGPTISKYMWPHRFIGVGERMLQPPA